MTPLLPFPTNNISQQVFVPGQPAFIPYTPLHSVSCAPNPQSRQVVCITSRDPRDIDGFLYSIDKTKNELDKALSELAKTRKELRDSQEEIRQLKWVEFSLKSELRVRDKEVIKSQNDVVQIREKVLPKLQKAEDQLITANEELVYLRDLLRRNEIASQMKDIEMGFLRLSLAKEIDRSTKVYERKATT